MTAGSLMKVPIDEVAVISLDAPVLSAYEARVRGVTRWFVWCKHCREWHSHGPAAGHREAHCLDQDSVRVRATLPIVSGGNTVAFHVWFDRDAN